MTLIGYLVALLIALAFWLKWLTDKIGVWYWKWEKNGRKIFKNK